MTDWGIIPHLRTLRKGKRGRQDPFVGRTASGPFSVRLGRADLDVELAAAGDVKDDPLDHGTLDSSDKMRLLVEGERLAIARAAVVLGDEMAFLCHSGVPGFH